MNLIADYILKIKSKTTSFCKVAIYQIIHFNLNNNSVLFCKLLSKMNRYLFLDNNDRNKVPHANYQKTSNYYESRK